MATKNTDDKPTKPTLKCTECETQGFSIRPAGWVAKRVKGADANLTSLVCPECAKKP